MVEELTSLQIEQKCLQLSLARQQDDLQAKITRLQAKIKSGKNVADSTEKLQLLQNKLGNLSGDIKREGLSDNCATQTNSSYVTVDGQIVLDERYKISENVWSRLLEYQKASVEWMWRLHKDGGGGILGDEMGLGKTIEVIAFLSGLLASDELSSPSLILCPATIVSQWADEISRWDAFLHPISLRTSREVSTLGSASIVLASYELFWSDSKNILTKDWAYVILDEGHKIRNPSSQISVLCKQLKSHRRLLLSGTPIQNKLKELWSLFDFVHPQLLGSLDVFQHEFSDAIEKSGYTNATLLQVEVGYQCAVKLRELISPYFLRRTKAQLQINLPSRKEKVLLCEMTEVQHSAYVSYIDQYCNDISSKVRSFECIRDLRTICNHPALLRSNMLPDVSSDVQASAKCVVLMRLVPAWITEGLKAVVFSQSKKMLRLMKKLLEEQSISCEILDGDLPMNQRMPLVNEFNLGSSIQVLLLTTKVGGIGLNLIGASRVVILDPDWNPMNDSQAKERACRIGQDKSVTIYRFVLKNTIEEKVYDRQIYKLFLSNRVTLT
jgi:DNA excision repair protein ERCC-6